MRVNNVDICVGLSWGDEGKGKLVSELVKIKHYDFVCRWNGGSNAGHTIYVNDEKYHTHIVPSGVFHNIKCLIGPECYINLDDFESEIKYLSENGFNTDLVKISPLAHIITDAHKKEDSLKYKDSQGSTCKGIAPCAKDKYGRIGKRVKDIEIPGHLQKYIFDDEIYGDILCEGAQGIWLDINYGDYPYVTSSLTLPYSACSLGFTPNKIRDIYGAIKIYDTRVGIDPEFKKNIIESDIDILNKIAEVGNEKGTTTGRNRNVNWLNVDKLVKSINLSGCTKVIISKIDILKQVNKFKLIINNELIEYKMLDTMINELSNYLQEKCYLKLIIFSDSPKEIKNLA